MELILRNGAIENKNAIEISETVYNAFCKESDYHSKEKDKIIINDKFFSDEKKVPDCIRHLNTPFQKMVEKKHWNESSQPVPDKINSEGDIVLILESPHVDEYTDKFEPLCPANGQTGILINKYFKKMFNEYSNNTIILTNPIQLQTSLSYLYAHTDKGKINRNNLTNLKNIVWRRIWNATLSNGSNDFKDRLNKYHPRIIINACTYSFKPHIRQIIKSLENQNNIEKIYEVYHPSVWNEKTQVTPIK